MKRMLAIFFGITMLLGAVGATAASAGHQDKEGPGPNGHNDKGLCTAYFNGQKNGHNKGNKESPPPFKSLEETAGGEPDGSAATASLVNEWCRVDAADGDGVEIGGNPNDNGRFNCADGTDGDFECTRETDPPGNS